MGERRRARADEHAARVNAAVELLRAHAPPEAARRLAAEHDLSLRQARRYLQAAASAPAGLPVPERTSAFTVKLPISLIARLRAYARASGASASAVAAQAVRAHLDRLEGRRGDGAAR